MKINIVEIYKKKVTEKVGYSIPSKFEILFTDKEKSIWFFTLLLIKSNPEKDEYDNNNEADMSNLNKMMSIFKSMGHEQFTIQEWFDYLSK